MKCWNYRVMRKYDNSLAIHEVYYNDEDVVESYTCDEVGAMSDSIEGLREELLRMLDCLEDPILDYK
jgi:hypothetical protein